jgi:hypothetical protein
MHPHYENPGPAKTASDAQINFAEKPGQRFEDANCHNLGEPFDDWKKPNGKPLEQLKAERARIVEELKAQYRSRKAQGQVC